MIENISFIYLLVINIVTFLVFIGDKQKARKKVWRVPESRLLMLALIGGSIGELIGMFVCKHKTRHLKFVVGIPFIIIIQVVMTYYIYSKLLF